MQPIKAFLNKIKWDKRENSDKYGVFYLDRISGKLTKVKFNNIKKFQGNFIVLESDDEEKYIPMHRIKEVRKSDIFVWKR